MAKDASSAPQNESAADDIFNFPDSFTFKVFGKNNDAFIEAVTTIFKVAYPDAAADGWERKLSKGDTYLSLSITVLAQSKKEVDAVYQQLTDCPDVLMAL